MSSNVRVAEDIGWDDGLEIPVANAENKKLTAHLQELRRNFDQKNGENANLNVKIKNLESHLKTVREELQNTLQMRNTRKKELDTEKHFTVVSEHENSRLSQLSRSLEKQLEQLREQRNIFENKIYQTNSKVEQLKNQMQWDQHALEAWLEESARRDEDALIFQKYRKQDNSKIKELQLSIEKMTEERNAARRKLEAETTETLTAQLELEKIAEEFRDAHAARQELISQWESSLNSMKQRDQDIKKEEDRVESTREEITARELIIKEKRAFTQTESDNNKELEKKIDIKERQNSKIREQKMYIQERTQQLENDVKTLQYQSDRSRKENESRIVMVDSLKSQFKHSEEKLANMQREMRDIEEMTENARKGLFSAAEAAKQADQITSENESKLKEKEAQSTRCRKVAFRKHQELQDAFSEEKQLELEHHGAKAGLRNLKNALGKLDHESIKTQEIIYNQDFTIANLDRRIARVLGEVNSEEKQVIIEKRDKLLALVEEKQERKNLIDSQMRKLSENSRRVMLQLEKTTKDYNYVCSKIEAFELHDDSSKRAHQNLIREKQDLMVENAILKLKVKKVEEMASNHVRGIVDLEMHRTLLETTLQERRIEIEQHEKLARLNVQCVEATRSVIMKKIHECKARVTMFRNRFEIINMQLKAPEGEENTSQAFHVIQVAQEREALKRRGDLLHAQIKKAETELEGLENTLVIINGGNERLRHNLRQPGENSAEHEDLQNLERNRRTVSETLRHKNRIVNELEDDLHLKEQTLIDHNEMLLRTQAIVDEQSSKRLMLQKEVEKSDERVTRVSDRLSKLEKDLKKNSDNLQFSADFVQTDARIKSMRELSKETLKTLGKVRDRYPELGLELEDSLAAGGLRIPTPSSICSPVSSARMSTSRSSVGSRGSRTSQNSAAIATSTVQLGLSAVSAPPNSAESSRAGTARFVRSTRSSTSSTKSKSRTLDKL